MSKQFRNILITAVIILVAVISATFVADSAMSVETHAGTIAGIDDKIGTVKVLAASSTLASVGTSAIKGDTATPIAEKLADCSEYFLLVLCVLYAEKYLLTVIGGATFRILIPIAAAFVIYGIFRKSPASHRFAAKLVTFGVLLYLIIPISVGVSNKIYETYQTSIDETLSQAEDFNTTTNALIDAGDNESMIETILSYFAESVINLTEKASNVLNRFTEAIAVLIVTSCIIPILVLLFFIWLVKAIWGVALPVPQVLLPKSERRKRALATGTHKSGKPVLLTESGIDEIPDEPVSETVPDPEDAEEETVAETEEAEKTPAPAETAQEDEIPDGEN